MRLWELRTSCARSAWLSVFVTNDAPTTRALRRRQHPATTRRSMHETTFASKPQYQSKLACHSGPVPLQRFERRGGSNATHGVGDEHFARILQIMRPQRLLADC